MANLSGLPIRALVFLRETELNLCPDSDLRKKTDFSCYYKLKQQINLWGPTRGENLGTCSGSGYLSMAKICHISALHMFDINVIIYNSIVINYSYY